MTIVIVIIIDSSSSSKGEIHVGLIMFCLGQHHHCHCHHCFWDHHCHLIIRPVSPSVISIVITMMMITIIMTLTSDPPHPQHQQMFTLCQLVFCAHDQIKIFEMKICLLYASFSSRPVVRSTSHPVDCLWGLKHIASLKLMNNTIINHHKHQSSSSSIFKSATL